MAYFFDYRIYFETSFLLPSDLTKERLQKAVDLAIQDRFRVFLCLIDEEQKCGYLSDERTTLELEEVSGNTINEIHNSVISLCRDDTKNGFRLFWGSDKDNQHYLVIHSHHGVADGFMITTFSHFLFCEVTGNECKTPLTFSLTHPMEKEENVAFPDHFDDISEIVPPSTYPKIIITESDKMNNIERVVDAATTKRALSLGRAYSAIGGNNCVHGLILYSYLRAILFSESLPQSGTMNINTVVNMRRYLKSMGEESPSICVSSFPVNVSVEGLLTHEENCGTIQRKVSSNLNKGLPLQILLGKVSPSIPEDCVELEVSNLGVHPANIFTRRLISQVIYNKCESASISVVVWLDQEGCMHFCLASVDRFVSMSRLESFADELVHQIAELAVVYPVWPNKQLTYKTQPSHPSSDPPPISKSPESPFSDSPFAFESTAKSLHASDSPAHNLESLHSAAPPFRSAARIYTATPRSRRCPHSSPTHVAATHAPSTRDANSRRACQPLRTRTHRPPSPSTRSKCTTDAGSSGSSRWFPTRSVRSKASSASLSTEADWRAPRSPRLAPSAPIRSTSPRWSDTSAARLPGANAPS